MEQALKYIYFASDEVRGPGLTPSKLVLGKFPAPFLTSLRRTTPYTCLFSPARMTKKLACRRQEVLRYNITEHLDKVLGPERGNA